MPCHVQKALPVSRKGFIVCKEDTRWSPSPQCIKLTCPKLKLSSTLKFRENCSSKILGEKCRLQCREGGSLIGSYYITCKIHSRMFYWTSLPQCTCSNPMLPEDLKAIEDCSKKKSGEVCYLKCSTKRTFISGNNFIWCQANTKWSVLPKCMRVMCSQPKLPKNLKFIKDCSSRSVGKHCTLGCRNGGRPFPRNYISCITTGNWSRLPSCSCPPPMLKNNLKFKNSKCNQILPVERTFGRAENNTEWSVESKCILKNCSKPTLPDILEFGENCTLKNTEEKCHVRCKENRRIIGKGLIVCKFNGSWTSLPYCSCPLLKLESNLRHKGHCGFQTPGQKCFLECEMGLKLKGPSFILCQNNSKWSSWPRCVKILCPNPVLQDELLELKEECSTKTIGDVCQVACKNGGILIGGKAMECLKDFQWSKPPDCTCANPYVSEPIELITKCDAIPKMVKCFFRCKSGYDIEGINYTTCQNNGKWGAFPACQKISCPEPALSSSVFKVNGKCSGKFYKDACIVKCKEGGQLNGEAEIKCEYTGIWSSFPHCTCPAPNPSNDLVLKNCSARIPDEHCFVECKENLKLIGNAFFVCQKNTKWSSKPKCIPKICPSPNVPEYLEISRNCSSKKIGEYCEVSCKHGGKVTGTNTTQCLPTSAWSSLPDCTCPVPNIMQSLIILKENCNFKKRYEHCAVACPQGYAFKTDGAFACLHNATWSPLPLCVKTHCSLPALDSEILKEDENCTFKKIGETCRVQCVQGGHLIDPEFLTCLTGGNWSSSPRCSCPILTISNDLNVVQDCNYPTPGFKCFVECKENLKLNGQNYILCMNNSKWSFEPKCVKTLCPNLVLKDNLLELKEVCSTKTIGDVCKVLKKGGKVVLGEKQWS
ncbi:sushi, von Willebrand factor type A, EGF and pentraxin domain-containing protein 1 [Trichonephila inaurata madagascariensis]|uniref:Sushi, von Willebrand factor type A, EGF and pentraxin domain-containing protein 1 n=1 Tax=Trichonephila inaurata madagascariensis TaxID=2747483 RepID=A0A8X6YRE1_9ARAC|nr:sushi, von Willebrand factor type A, EGF and pentraxin domain-containing protein 1 [Trichonephila inaurata madagascariensis]